MLTNLNPSTALLGDIFSVQRYFSSSLGINVQQSYGSRPFSTFSNVQNSVLLAVNSRLEYPSPYGIYSQEDLNLGSVSLPYNHPFNVYYNPGQPSDFTQTVLFAPAQLVNGSLSVSFFLNDFQTSYSIYAEAYNTLGQTGV